ncbi:electron transport complex subunit RsxC [Candidatus Aerophobetes bacterium]|nr:electron transport complex subunit RsxC [Candidatus Aerophobetes bacterium]
MFRTIFKGKSFSGGVKVPENKLTENESVEVFPAPKRAVLPLAQHIGAPCEPVVKRGDKVKTGQIIANSKAFVSAPIHASISGKVTGFIKTITPSSGKVVEAIVIDSDGEDEWERMEAMDLSAPRDELLKRIRDAGIVGLGGATFPTHVKLSPPKDKRIDTIILNGCECEPYVTSDHRVMLEEGEKVLLGLEVIKRILSCDNAIIAIEENKENAISHLRDLIKRKKISTEVVSLKTKYPQGAEKVLIKVLLNREVPLGGLPFDVGVIVQNVSTARAIYEAVFEGKALIRRVLTVTGMVKRPKNLLVRFGTSIESLIDHCGRMEGADEVITGGPMMGISLPVLDLPVTKDVNCILVKRSLRIEERDCIRCGSCVRACPMNLLPTELVKYIKAGMYERCSEYYIDDCMECGSCAYVCPAGIPIVQYIKVAKNEIRRRVKGGS